jgi:hypothetical protein
VDWTIETTFEPEFGPEVLELANLVGVSGLKAMRQNSKGQSRMLKSGEACNSIE